MLKPRPQIKNWTADSFIWLFVLEYRVKWGEQMIDIHTHILPGLDDGPHNLAEALEMACSAVERGMQQVVATPHLHATIYANTRAKILTSVAMLNQALQENKIALEVLPGSEVLVLPDLVDRFEAGDVMTINDGGKYLLLEYPCDLVPI